LSTLLLGHPGGARRPRVETHPPYERTYAPAAIELCRRAGQVLDPWQCDGLDVMLGLRHDDKWACFEYAEWVPRQNGKGALGEARVLTGFFILKERLLLWSAHEYKTALEAFRRIVGLVDELGERVSKNLIMVGGVPVKVNNTNGEESLERLDTGQRIKFIARTAGSGRGFSGDVNVIDEAFAYTAIQQGALMPTLSAKPNPQLVYLSSPPLDGETGEVMYGLRRRAEAGGDDSLGYRDWGLAGDLSNLRVIDLADLRNAEASNPSMGMGVRANGSTGVTEETVLRELRSMSAEDFARERYGIWPLEIHGEGGVIDSRLWTDLSDPDSRRHGDVSIAVDVTPLRDHASVSIFGIREDGLEHTQTVAYGEGTDWVVGKVLELKTVLDPLAIVLDPKGAAGSLIGNLAAVGIKIPEDPEFPERGDLALPTVNEVAAGVGQYIDAARQRRLRHTGQAHLTSAVSNAKTRPLGDAVAWGRKQSDVDISPLVSATLARWGWFVRQDIKDKVVELTGSLMA
jgi:hypothetical protein